MSRCLWRVAYNRSSVDLGDSRQPWWPVRGVDVVTQCSLRANPAIPQSPLSGRPVQEDSAWRLARMQRNGCGCPAVRPGTTHPPRKCMVECDFDHIVHPKAVRLSDRQFCLVVQPLHGTRQNTPFRYEPIQQQTPVAAKTHAPLFSAGPAGTHHPRRPFIQELARPGHRSILPESLKLFPMQVRTHRLQVVLQHGPQRQRFTACQMRVTLSSNAQRDCFSTGSYPSCFSRRDSLARISSMALSSAPRRDTDRGSAPPLRLTA